MREFKFRVWNLDTKRFYLEGNCFLSLDGELLRNSVQFLEGNYKIQQYTGLKDKNRKEIYEGDIIISDPVWHDAKTFRSVVLFDQGMFGINIKQHGKEMIKLTSMINEVVGNIYENPELLELKHES